MARVRAVALGSVVFFGVLFAACDSAPAKDATAREASPPSARAPVGFRSRAALEEHFRKHGGDIRAASRDDYLRRAQRLRDLPLEQGVLEVRRADGVVSRFDRSTGEFLAFDPDGVIRTFFRPNDGEAYFWRQSRRRQTR